VHPDRRGRAGQPLDQPGILGDLGNIPGGAAEPAGSCFSGEEALGPPAVRW
jgi:hypothetical protein